jgi:FMN phosphatase YigB (HAD superfamily)
MTTVVFFDVAGTLIRVRDGVGTQYARVAARFGGRRRSEDA